MGLIKIRQPKKEAPARQEPRMVWRIGEGERCDRCRIARAYVAVRLLGTELLFCAHHFREHEVALRLVADEIIDERQRLLLRPTLPPGE